MKLIPASVLCCLFGASNGYEHPESCHRHQSLFDCEVQVVNGLTGSCVAVSTSIDTFYGDGGESPALVSTSHDNLTTISLFDQGEQAVLLPTSHVDDSFRGEHGGGFAALDDDSSLRHGGGGRLAALVATTLVCSLLFKLLSFVIGIAAGLPLFVTRWLEHQSSNFVRESYNPYSKCNHYGFVLRTKRGELRNECLGRKRGKHKHNHSGRKYMSGGCRKEKKGNRDRPHHTNHSEKKKKRRDRSKKKFATPPTPPSPSSKQKAPRTPAPTPASAPTATPPAPTSAAPTARTPAPASATPSATKSESTPVPKAPTEVPDPEDFDRVWEQARANAMSKSSTSPDETPPASPASTSATTTPSRPVATPPTVSSAASRSTKSHWNWHKVFDISSYWMLLSLLRSYSASFLAILVYVLGTMFLYKVGMLQKLVGAARLPLPFFVFICTCILPSFTQALDIEGEDDEIGDEGFYDAHFGQDHQWSEEQRHAIQVVINFCKQIAIKLFNSNQLFVPGGHWWTIAGAFTLDNLAQLGDSSKSVIYTVGTKVGQALKGNVRKRLGYPNVRDKIFVIFNLDHQRGDQHKKLVDSIIGFCREFCKGITPSNLAALTIEQAIAMEAAGLPFFATLFFYSIAHSAEECKFLGGGRAIQGFLRRIILFVVESGVQALFPLLGIRLDKSTMPHEFITGYGLLEWVKESHATCIKAGEAFFKELKDTFGDLDSSTDERVEKFKGSFIQYVLKKCIRMTALSSWKPNIKCVPLTAVILNLIFNIGMWWDAFGDRMTKPDYPYDPSKGYNDGDRNFAFRNFEDFLKGIESTLASFAALDSNSEMLKAPYARGRSLVTILMERNWKHFFSFRQFGLNIEVYYFQKAAGWWPSFLFIHGPPCRAFNTESPTLSSEEIRSMRHRAVELHLLLLFSRRFLSRTMTNGFNVSKDLANYTVLGSILMAHAMFQYLVANFHICTKTACLFSKNMIVSFNAFLEEARGYVNGLYNENCNRGLVSFSARGENRRTNTSGMTQDMNFRQTILNIFSRCFNQQCLVAGLKVLTVKDSLSLAVDGLKKETNRWTQFKEKNLIGAELLNDLKDVWKRSRKNGVDSNQDKINATQELMKNVEGWPKTWPTGLTFKSAKNTWVLGKSIFKCRIQLTFPDTMQGLLAALNVLNRFIALKPLKENEIKAATDEQLKNIRKVMNKHCQVKEGETCDCEWCKEDSEWCKEESSSKDKKRKSTSSEKQPATKKHNTK